jgi:uracil-DNA glycosylase
LSRLAQPLESLLGAPGGAIHGDWQPLLDAWRSSAGGRALIEAVDARVADGAVVYPAEVFRAFALTPLAQTRVLILGQDPYHGPGQAEGLAFSVPAGQRLPPSLRNIFRELKRDLGLPAPTSGSLAAWARRGVLLLNAALTVEDGVPGRHAKLGWQALTDAVCVALSQDGAPKVFMLWGAHAQAKAPLFEPARAHRVLRCNHPSPLSATRPPLPFIGCGHFGAANRFLADAGRGAVDWTLA